MLQLGVKTCHGVVSFGTNPTDLTYSSCHRFSSAVRSHLASFAVSKHASAAASSLPRKSRPLVAINPEFHLQVAELPLLRVLKSHFRFRDLQPGCLLAHDLKHRHCFNCSRQRRWFDSQFKRQTHHPGYSCIFRDRNRQELLLDIDHPLEFAKCLSSASAASHLFSPSKGPAIASLEQCCTLSAVSHPRFLAFKTSGPGFDPPAPSTILHPLSIFDVGK